MKTILLFLLTMFANADISTQIQRESCKYDRKQVMLNMDHVYNDMKHKEWLGCTIHASQVKTFIVSSITTCGKTKGATKMELSILKEMDKAMSVCEGNL